MVQLVLLTQTCYFRNHSRLFCHISHNNTLYLLQGIDGSITFLHYSYFQYFILSKYTSKDDTLASKIVTFEIRFLKKSKTINLNFQSPRSFIRRFDPLFTVDLRHFVALFKLLLYS